MNAGYRSDATQGTCRLDDNNKPFVVLTSRQNSNKVKVLGYVCVSSGGALDDNKAFVESMIMWDDLIGLYNKTHDNKLEVL